MVDRIPGKNVASPLLTLALDSLRAGSGKKASAPTEPLISVLEQSDPEKAAALRKKLEEAKGILDRIKSAKVDFDEQRKAAAQEKIQRIKEQLKMLRMLAAVNPEAAARRAAQLSRELSAAVKEYAGAGGGAGAGLAAGVGAAGIGMPAEGMTGGTAVAAAGAAVAPESGGNSVTEAPAAVPEAGALEGPSASPDAAEPSAPPMAVGLTDDVPSQGMHTDEQSGEGAEAGEGSLRERVQEQVAEANRTFAADRADQDFARDVREIKNALKAILEAAKRKLEQEGDPSADQDIKDAEKALNDVDRTLAQMSTTGMTGLAGVVNILA